MALVPEALEELTWVNNSGIHAQCVRVGVRTF